MPTAYPTVLHMLAAAVEAAPDQLALRCGSEELTYRAYGSCVAGFAEDLGPGVRGGRVALVMGNSIDIAIATFAVGAAGAQVVPLNPAYTAHELHPILEDATPVAIVCDEGLSATVSGIAEQIGVARVIRIGADKRLTAWQTQSLALPPPPEPQALSTLQYTGGTTGRSKGVNLSHAAVAINVAQREAPLPSGDGERILIVTPLYHSYAIAMGLHLAVYCRGLLTILPRYRPDDALAAIARERITLFAGSPTLFVGLMAHENFPATDFSSLQLCFSGASALPVETLRRWEQATGCGICEGYGQSEAGPVLTYNPRNGVRKPGSAGTALPRTEIEIVDIATGELTLAVGQTGEIRARGPQIMAGYRNRADETAAALRDGWLYTGDVGMLDEDGYLFIQDRKKDMVIVGGFNVYPREVEEVLCEHTAVQEAAVIGVPDSYRGEALRAYVVLRPGATATPEDLSGHLRERLTRYKNPRDIIIRSGLPKTGVGKIDKTRLRSGDAW
jgi:long-chain acyl-CoA synthetase